MPRPSGPGPAAYTLPSTFGYEKCDARKSRGPQYSFGQRPVMPAFKKYGPSPADYKIGQVTRFGSTKGLEFSMLKRGQLNKPNTVRYD